MTKEKAINKVKLSENYISKLELSNNVKVKSIKLLKQIYRNNIMIRKKELKGVIGGILYIISLFEAEKMTQREIANMIGISEPTIRNRLKEILEIMSNGF